MGLYPAPSIKIRFSSDNEGLVDFINCQSVYKLNSCILVFCHTCKARYQPSNSSKGQSQRATGIPYPVTLLLKAPPSFVDKCSGCPVFSMLLNLSCLPTYQCRWISVHYFVSIPSITSAQLSLAPARTMDEIKSPLI